MALIKKFRIKSFKEQDKILKPENFDVLSQTANLK